MSLWADMNQDQRLLRLERRLHRVESSIKGENQMSRLIKDLIGMECTINGDDFYNSKCTVVDADDQWIKVIVHEKKNDFTKIVRIDTIDKIELY